MALGLWLPEPAMNALRRMDAHFRPLPEDILVTSFPRTGTTWLMALTFAILHRSSQLRKTGDGENIDLNDDDPLLTQNPHEVILSLEYRLCRESATSDVERSSSSPRIFQTHLSYSRLSESVKQSGCRIIDIARNPKDTLVSFWHYRNTNRRRPNVSLGELFDAFWKGTVVHGDFHDHVLGYWKERNKVFFITYEELTEDPFKHVKRLAEFLGYSLTSEEVKDIVWRRSFQRESSAEGNNGGRVDYFGFLTLGKRRWVILQNHLTPEMVQILDEITQRKIMGTGLELST